MKKEKVPNLFVVGAQKSATTYLSTMISTHPNVYIPEVEEPHFFCRKKEVKKGKNYYTEKYYSEASKEKWKVDASTSYMVAPNAPKLIDEIINKKKKFIFVLRHPIDRITSAFTFHTNVHEMLEERSLREIYPNNGKLKKMNLKNVLKWEEEKVEGLKKSGHKKRNSWEKFGFPLRYFHASNYSSHIERYLNIFCRKQTCFLKFENVVNKDANEKVLNFLKIEPTKLFEEGKPKKNETVGYSEKTSRAIRSAKEVLKPIVPTCLQKMMVDVEDEILKKKPISYEFGSDTYCHLNQIFDEEIRKTADLTGLDLSDWLSKNHC